MYFRQVGLTTTEIQGMLETEDMSGFNMDLFVMPPDEDNVSDEDSEDEDELLPKDINHLGKGVLSQEAELTVYDPRDVLPDTARVRPKFALLQKLLFHIFKNFHS